MTDLNNDMQYQGRIIISIKDVVVMYDCHRITAWRKLTKIKEYYEKPENGDVTIYEFSTFTGIPLEIVKTLLRK